jgi:hypothetical protein
MTRVQVRYLRDVAANTKQAAMPWNTLVDNTKKPVTFVTGWRIIQLPILIHFGPYLLNAGIFHIFIKCAQFIDGTFGR